MSNSIYVKNFIVGTPYLGAYLVGLDLSAKSKQAYRSGYHFLPPANSSVVIDQHFMIIPKINTNQICVRIPKRMGSSLPHLKTSWQSAFLDVLFVSELGCDVIKPINKEA